MWVKITDKTNIDELISEKHGIALLNGGPEDPDFSIKGPKFEIVSYKTETILTIQPFNPFPSYSNFHQAPIQIELKELIASWYHNSNFIHESKMNK